MHKNIPLVVGIIILFLGLAIQPSIATPQLKKIDGEQDVEGLVAQLRVAVNEKLEKYESYPKVAGFWDIFWDTVNYLLGLLEKIGLYIFFIPIFILVFLFTTPT